MSYDDDDYPCPHCGEPLAAEAEFCRACGSDQDTGWSEFADYPGLDLPDQAEDEYEQEAATAGLSPWQKLIIVVAALLILALLWQALWP